LHHHVLDAKNLLAFIYFYQGNIDKSKLEFDRVLKLREELFGKMNYQNSFTWRGLALVHEALKEYEKASECAEKCFQIREAQLGPQHVFVAEGIQDYLRIQHKMKSSDLLFWSDRVLAIYSKVFSSGHPAFKQSLDFHTSLFS